MAIASLSVSAQETSAEARKFVADHEKKVQPLEIEIGRAWWKANEAALRAARDQPAPPK